MNNSRNIVLNQSQFFFKNGWCSIDPKSLGITNEISKKLLNIKKVDYVKNPKNLGVYSLNQNSIKNYSVFQELTKNDLIKETISKISGRKVGLSCIMHMLGVGKSPSLHWNIDSHIRENKFIGPVPSVIKLMLTNNSLTQKDGPFEVITGSHTLDLNNKIFDKLIPLFFYRKKQSFISNKRQCILFDGRIIHRRSYSLNDGFRSATILSYTSKLT